MTTRHELARTEDQLYDKAQEISRSFIGWYAADVMGVLALLTRFAMEKHVKPECMDRALDDLRDWVLGDMDPV